MLRNYLAAALRNLWRNRTYAAINIVGLALGFAAAILIGLYVRDEYSYDRFFPDHQRLFKVDETFSVPGQPAISGSQANSDIAELLKLDFPQIEVTTRLVRAEFAVILRRGDINGLVPLTCWVDANFFRLFPFRTLAGNLTDALSRPDGIVLTRKIARRFFGRDQVVGETLTLNGEHVMRVTAVIEDLPSNTHFVGEVFLPGIANFSDLTRLDAVKRDSGLMKSFQVYTYIRLRPGASVESINSEMDRFAARHLHGDIEPGVPLAKALTMVLSPVASAHLGVRQIDAMKPQGDPRTLQILSGIALLILLVAGSNFVSMMTARSLQRAVEVGVRKTLGATRRQVIVQFMSECVLSAGAALLIAALAVDVALPALNGFLQRDVAFDYVRSPRLGAALLAVALLVGVAAGAYLSLVLSRLRPNVVLKGSVGLAGGSGRLREILVVLQFATLVALMVVTVTVGRQARYAVEDRLRLPTEPIYWTRGCDTPFPDAVERLPGVRAVSCVSAPALAQSHWGATVNSPRGGASVSLETSMIDYSYFDLFNIKPIAGRLLRRDHGEDDVLHAGDGVAENPSLVLNESATRALGYGSPRDAVGQYVRWTRPTAVGGVGKMMDAMASQVVGVVPDFSFGSVRDVIEPTAYYVDPAMASYAFLIKLDGRRVPETLRAIKETWTRQSQDPFEGTFLSQYLQDLYLDITRQAQLFTWFSSVAVVLAALGLLGLAVFTAERRTKEVALRKVMGALRLDILRFLGWQFARPVFVATLIAWPCAYLFVHHWLQGFAYHVSLSQWTFAGAGALALIIALLTVAGHSFMVARARPVEALRYE